MLLPNPAQIAAQAVDLAGRLLSGDDAKRRQDAETLARDSRFVRRQVDRLNVVITNSLQLKSTPQQRDEIIGNLRGIARAAEDALINLKA